MDPHSISSFTITLTQAAAIVTTALGNIAQLRTADTRLAGLCEELSDLPAPLQDIGDALEKCEKSDLAPVHDALSRQCDSALESCHMILRELGQLVDKIWESSPGGDGWKSKSSIDLSIFGEEFTTYRDKIRLFNSAFQTMLQVITLCLALRANDPEDQISGDLDHLQASIDESLHASSRPVGGFRRAKGANKADSQISQNVRQLAEEARAFHYTTSSAVDTPRSHDVPPHHAPHEPAEDDVFDTSNTEAPGMDSAHLAPTPLRSARTSFSSVFSSQDKTEQDARGILDASGPVSTKYAGPAGEEDDGGDDELEQEYLDGLRELAAASIWKKEYAKAAEYLNDALFRGTETESTQMSRRQLQTQLALCYFLQGNWRQAELLVKDLARVKDDDELIIYNFLHALSLAHLGEYAFGYAFEYCKLALNGKRKLCKNLKADWVEYQETLGLFATIFDLSGDYIRAEVFKRRLPPGFEYSHPTNEISFIQSKKDLLVSILGEEDTSATRPKSFRAELEGGQFEKQTILKQALLRHASMPIEAETNLRRNLSQYQKYDADTAKEVIAIVAARSSCDADDENPHDSLMSPPPPVLRSRLSFGRLFGAKNSRSNTLDGKDDSSQSPVSDTPITETPSAKQKPITETPTAKQKWLGIAKPKLLLRKMKSESKIPGLSVTEASPQEGSFSLINMQRLTTPTQSQSARQCSWGGPRSQPFDTDAPTGSQSAPIHGRFRSNSCVSDLDAPLSGLPSRAPSPFHESEIPDVSVGTAGRADQLPPPTFELADTSQSSLPSDPKGSSAPDELLTPTAHDHPTSPSLAPELDFLGAAMVESRDRTSVISSRSPSPFSPPPDPLPFARCSSKEFEESVAIAGAKEPTLLARAHSARSCFGLIEVASPIEYSPVELASKPVPVSNTPSPAAAYAPVSKPMIPDASICDSPVNSSPVDELPIEDSPNLETASDVLPNDDSSVDESVAESLSEIDPQLITVLGEVASILASLNDEGKTDVQDLKDYHSRLTVLFPDLKDMSRDQLVVDDIRGVLFTLRKRIKNWHKKVEDDSGYESSSPRAETATAVSEDVTKEAADPQAVEPVATEPKQGIDEIEPPEEVEQRPSPKHEPVPVKQESINMKVPAIVTTEVITTEDGSSVVEVAPIKVEGESRLVTVHTVQSTMAKQGAVVTAAPVPMRPGSVIKPNHVMVTASPIPKDDKLQQRIMNLVSTLIDEASPTISAEATKSTPSVAQQDESPKQAPNSNETSDASNGKAFLLDLWNSLIEEGGESDLRISIDPPKRARTESDAESTTGGVKLAADPDTQAWEISEYVFDESHSSNWDWDEWRSIGSNMGRPLQSLQPSDLYGA
ncbi:unnamed protein product [Clonostachys byssicola]|uniref:Fungal N-terminal domain-containing protein n=1 Tax=Clonostachys byssicola TaxID=160290 RepID=A0A9N9U379_9HYPO|nr:unnamed protein product [Clonostachys byssicola]